MPRFYTLTLLVLCCLCSCLSKKKSEVRTGNNIKKADRKEIQHLVEGVYKSIQKQDARYICQLFPDGNKINDTVSAILSRVRIAQKGYSVNRVGEFHVLNHGMPEPLRQKSVASSISNYGFTYFFTPYTEETYVYLFYTPGAADSTDILVSLEFSRLSGKWKLTNIAFGLFLYKNMLAPKLAYEAYDYFLHNKLLLSAYYMSLTESMALPAQNRFVFHSHPDIERLVGDVKKDYGQRFAFPLTVSVLKSKPVLLGVSAVNELSGPRVVIQYQSSFVNEPSAANSENENLHLLREVAFPGITYIGDSVMYNVVSDTTVLAQSRRYIKSNQDVAISNEDFMKVYFKDILPDSVRRRVGK